MQMSESDTHLLFTEEVFDQTAHDLLWRPGCADVRSDQTAQHTLRVADPPCNTHVQNRIQFIPRTARHTS